MGHNTVFGGPPRPNAPACGTQQEQACTGAPSPRHHAAERIDFSSTRGLLLSVRTQQPGRGRGRRGAIQGTQMGNVRGPWGGGGAKDAKAGIHDTMIRKKVHAKTDRGDKNRFFV